MRIAVEEHLKTRREGLVFQVVPRDGPAFTIGHLSRHPFRVVHVAKLWTEVAAALWSRGRKGGMTTNVKGKTKQDPCTMYRYRFVQTETKLTIALDLSAHKRSDVSNRDDSTSPKYPAGKDHARFARDGSYLG